MVPECETGIAGQMRDVLLGPSKQIVDAQNLVPLGQESVDQMRPEKSGPPGDEYMFAAVICSDQLRTFRFRRTDARVRSCARGDCREDGL